MIDGGPALIGVLRQLGLPDELMSPLLAYEQLVKRDADRLGLVSKRGLEEFRDRHVAESLAFALVRRPLPDEHWLDVGSGAGLPGIPLAICFPDTQFTLIEPQQRRAGFLELSIADLGIDSASVVCERVQDVKELGDVVVTRAFSSKEASGHSAATFSLLAGVAKPDAVRIIQIARDVEPTGATQRVEVALASVDSFAHFLIMHDK